MFQSLLSLDSIRRLKPVLSESSRSTVFILDTETFKCEADFPSDTEDALLALFFLDCFVSIISLQFRKEDFGLSCWNTGHVMSAKVIFFS